MEIRRVEYKNVYGSLSGKLTFKQGENFLVGINGCGKTTVLNLISWVLKPCWPALCTLPHDLIKIEVKHNKYLYSIQSRIVKDKHELKVVTKDKSRAFKPIKTLLTIIPQHIREKKNLEEIRLEFEDVSFMPESHELGTWRFLQEDLPSPIFIGLERSAKNKPSSSRFRRTQKGLRVLPGGTAHDRAINLMKDAFNTSRQSLVEINDKLNRQVLELSFSGVISRTVLHRYSTANISLTAQKIQKLRDRFESSDKEDTSSNVLSAKEVRDAAVKYLKKLSSLLGSTNSINKKQKDQDKILVMLNHHNLERADKMFDLFEEHESKVQKVQLEITNFKKEVNRFLVDSGKSIHFDYSTGSPYLRINASSEKLRLADLSSGEFQIVVLLSYFAFLAKRGIPIIIDEPELSLHVQWQKNFVNAVKEVMPEGCQTIMATHSPEICGAEDVNVQSILVRWSR